jgi:hypothetical protein
LLAPSAFQVAPLSVEYWNVIVPVGVPPMPPTITSAVTEPPKVIGLTGLRVGTETVEAPAALTACELANRHIDSEIKNVTTSNCSFFMFLHSDVYG